MKFIDFQWFYVNIICITWIIALAQANWWNLGLVSWRGSYRNRAYLLAPQPVCLRAYGLSYAQTRLCQTYPDHMPVVSLGARLGIKECREKFRHRRWNCTSHSTGSAFGPVTGKGTPEAGFAHAISAAGVVHVLARSCREARLSTCSCSESMRPNQLHRDWQWGGCGDNLVYAAHFARSFIDVKEKEKSYPRGSPQLARMLMNLHNNKAGRLAVYKLASVACKCHGLSSSCSLRTCWKQLSPFQRVSNRIVQHYDKATPVRFNRRGTKLRRTTTSKQRRPRRDDIIYLESSPDFCNPGSAVLGTRGRECAVSAPGKNATDACQRLCCGRGYIRFAREVKEKCRCQFFWCCRVTCQTCIRLEEVHVCN